MKCAIFVLKRLESKYQMDLKEVIKQCETEITNQGLNFFTLYSAFKQEGINVMAVHSLTLKMPCPYIAFYRYHHTGHYVLVESISDKVSLYDPEFGEICESKWRFYLKWSKTVLLFPSK